MEFEKLDATRCDAPFAARDPANEVPIATMGGHQRDAMEDVAYAFVIAARHWPDRFLEHVMKARSQRLDMTILNALGEVDRPQARELLIAAASQRQAGHAFGRQAALRSLIRLADPRVPDLLVNLVKDRDSSVRFTAVLSAIDHGDLRLLPRLRHIAEGARTPPGERELALDAIEAIALREGRTDLIPPPEARRLTELPRPATRTAIVTVSKVYVRVGDRVAVGQELARLRVGSRSHRVVAPCGGVVASVGVAAGRASLPIMFRIRV